MKLLTFRKEEKLVTGIVTNKGVLDLALAAQMLGEQESIPVQIGDILGQGQSVLDQLARLVSKAEGIEEEGVFLPEDELVLGPSVPNPGKIICVGLNYRRHAEETNAPIPTIPILFSKYSNALTGHGSVVDIPAMTAKLDYEAELAVVIGRQARNVRREEALAYVGGYCSSNDLSARDLQLQTSQWLAGKSCDGFCPIGPYLVTSDEIENPNALQIRAYVNGEMRQNSNTSDMIFHVDEIISYISSLMTLEPGDVILTGTPEGVVLGYPPEKQVYLQANDVVTVEIEKLGSLTNSFKSV